MSEINNGTLYIWAEEGGIELKLTRDESKHRIVVEIVTRSSAEKVLATATMASFRWQRIADFFTPECIPSATAPVPTP